MSARKPSTPPLPPPSPEVLALLRTVREHYYDDAPRLVLADYLEENGEPDRADLIRLSVKRAQFIPSDIRYGELFRQELPLWERRKADWLGAIAPLLDYCVAERGLFEWELTAARFLSVRFRSEPGVFPWVGRLDLRRVRALQLPGLSLVTAFPSLWSLALRGLDPQARPGECAFLSHVASLELTKVRLAEDRMRELLHSPHLANLQELNLHECGLYDAGAHSLAESPTLARLRKLHLSMNGIETAGAIAIVTSPHLAGLEDLSLRFNQAGDQFARVLAASPQAASLRRLNLEANFLSDAGVRALLESPHLKLAYLNVHYNNVSQPLWKPLRERFGRVDL